MKSVLTKLLLLAVSLVMQLAFAQTEVDGGSQVQIGRYSTQMTIPGSEVSEPLNVYVRIRFPRETITTIGEALNHTLLRTGYRLQDIGLFGEFERQFLELPLPESQRVLGPYQVNKVLSALLGPAWQLQSDPVSRVVSFTRK